VIIEPKIGSQSNNRPLRQVVASLLESRICRELLKVTSWEFLRQGTEVIVS